MAESRHSTRRAFLKRAPFAAAAITSVATAGPANAEPRTMVEMIEEVCEEMTLQKGGQWRAKVDDMGEFVLIMKVSAAADHGGVYTRVIKHDRDTFVVAHSQS